MITIYGELSSLNEYTRACRSNQYYGAKMKSENEMLILKSLTAKHVNKIKKYPIKLKLTWYVKDKRKDPDNITFAIKFILDALVKYGILENDTQKHIQEIHHYIKVDKKNPRVEIEYETIS